MMYMRCWYDYNNRGVTLDSIQRIQFIIVLNMEDFVPKQNNLENYYFSVFILRYYVTESYGLLMDTCGKHDLFRTSSEFENEELNILLKI